MANFKLPVIIFLYEMEYDAEYFERMLREEERNRRDQRHNDDRGRKKHPSVERSRDDRYE